MLGTQNWCFNLASLAAVAVKLQREKSTVISKDCFPNISRVPVISCELAPIAVSVNGFCFGTKLKFRYISEVWQLRKPNCCKMKSALAEQLRYVRLRKVNDNKIQYSKKLLLNFQKL